MQWPTRKKKGKTAMQIFEYVENEKGYHLVKKRKIADSSLRNEAKSQRAEKHLYGICLRVFWAAAAKI